MPDETLTVASGRLRTMRDDAAGALERGEIDAELHADLAHLIEAQAQDELVYREPLTIDYGSRCSHNPAASRWTRLRQFFGARRKSRKKASMRAASIPSSKYT